MDGFYDELPVRIEIFNLLGNKVLGKVVSAQPMFNLDVSDNQAGVYILRLTQGDRSGVARLIKR